MFNAPRPQRLGASNSFANGFGSASFMTDNPLASSTYDGLDPWSNAPTPDLPPVAPAVISTSPSLGTGPPSVLSSVIADATAPAIYHRAFGLIDPTSSGETSVGGLSRVLTTSGLSASTIDRIVNLVSSQPRVTKHEFFVALALVALAQSGKDPSIEQVASLASQNALPVPTLDLDSVAPNTSILAAPPYYRRESSSMSASMPALTTSPPTATTPRRPPQHRYTSDDPWSAGGTLPAGGISGARFPGGGLGGGLDEGASLMNGAPSSVSGTGLPREWWRRQERVQVRLLGPQGFILNRYMVYEISTDRGSPVSRRYSEFSFLWDCLVRRYPFRLLPQLPPKRIGADEGFLEQRRRGLARFLNFVVNHPVIKDDGLLAVFLTEPSLEQWRKHNAISLEEESMSKRVDRVEEMSIPADLEDKLGVVRAKIGSLIEQWQKLSLLTERLVKRREAAAVRNPHALFRRSFLSTYLTPTVSPSFTSGTLPSSPRSLASSMTLPHSAPSMASSLTGSIVGSLHLPSSPLIGSRRPDGSADGGFYTSVWENGQADMSRLQITLNALNEVNEHCWKGEYCELCQGVRAGLETLSGHLARDADEAEQRTKTLMDNTVEAVKSQRDLYIAMRDLLIRHDRLSGDQIERLKKRIEGNGTKLEGIRAAQKEGWENEVDKIATLIERDQATISNLLNRRVFIRLSMWHELRVVLHNRENALVSKAIRELSREEAAYAERVAQNWAAFAENVDGMPFE